MSDHTSIHPIVLREARNYCITRAILLLLPGVAIAVVYHWTFSIDSLKAALIILWMLLNGGLHGYRAYHCFVRRRSHTELLFDGVTVRIVSPGGSEQAFSKRECLAYYPHRNEVVLTGGRTIHLPAATSFTLQNEFSLAQPWIERWWPAINLHDAIKKADNEAGWLEFVPSALRLIGVLLAVSGATMIGPGEWSLNPNDFYFGCILLVAVLPASVEKQLRRRSVIRFPAQDRCPASAISRSAEGSGVRP